jgi:hypothetical protein
MEPKEHLFKEAIETFKVIDTCLSCYYEGKIHMYRPLAAQLRILFCDYCRKKNNALLSKIFNNLMLIPLRVPEYEEMDGSGGTYSGKDNLCASPIDKNLRPKVATMPFEISIFNNGIETCDLLLQEDSKPIPLDVWLVKKITDHPLNVTIADLIRTVADRGGGAHVHNKIDSFLASLQKRTPCKISLDILFTIAIARFAQRVGFLVIQFYEKIGTKGKMDDLMKQYDIDHPCIVNSAQIPRVLLEQEHSKFNLKMMQNVKQIWLDQPGSVLQQFW